MNKNSGYLTKKNVSEVFTNKNDNESTSSWQSARVVAGCGSVTHDAPRCRTNKRSEEYVGDDEASAGDLVSHARSVCLLGGDQTGRAVLFTSGDSY